MVYDSISPLRLNPEMHMMFVDSDDYVMMWTRQCTFLSFFFPTPLSCLTADDQRLPKRFERLPGTLKRCMRTSGREEGKGRSREVGGGGGSTMCRGDMFGRGSAKGQGGVTVHQGRDKGRQVQGHRYTRGRALQKNQKGKSKACSELRTNYEDKEEGLDTPCKR